MPILYQGMLSDRDQKQTSGRLEVYSIHYPPIVLGQTLSLVYIMKSPYNMVHTILNGSYNIIYKYVNAKPSCWIVI